MSKNDDALRCAKDAEQLAVDRLCAKDSNAWAVDANVQLWMCVSKIRRLVAENEAQAALLRQAKQALSTGTHWMTSGELIKAIDAQLGGRA